MVTKAIEQAQSKYMTQHVAYQTAKENLAKYQSLLNNAESTIWDQYSQNGNADTSSYDTALADYNKQKALYAEADAADSRANSACLDSCYTQMRTGGLMA